VAQVDSVDFGGTWASTETVTTTINGKAHVLTMGSAVSTATQAATAYKKAWNGTAPDANEFTENFSPADEGEWAEITASTDPADDTIVVLTGDTPGKPFTVTSVAETSAAGTAVLSTEDVTATGMWHFTDVDNWDGGVVPVDADDILFDRGSTSCLYGISQSATTPASITIRSEYTGQIGLARVNVDDASMPYNEYRTRALTLGAAADATDIQIHIGQGDGAGSSRIVLNLGTSDFTAKVYSTGSRSNSSIPIVLLVGSATTPELYIYSGDVGVGLQGDATTLTKAHLLSSTASLVVGPGTIWTSGGELVNEGGTVVGTVTIP